MPNFNLTRRPDDGNAHCASVRQKRAFPWDACSYDMYTNTTSTEINIPRDAETNRRTSSPPPIKPSGYVTDLLRRFLGEEVRITTRPNRDITTNEMLEVLIAYCEYYGRRMPPVRIIRRFLPRVVWEVYGIGTSHSIRRDGKPRRGYRRLEWKPLEDSGQSASVPESEPIVL